MDLDWVRTFLAAADGENFRRAAKQRFVSQATVSQHVARLEAALGAPLFERAGRRVRLSPAGRAFVPYARRLVATADAGREQVWAVRAGRSRPFRLAVAPLLAESSLLSWLCREILRHEPRTDLTVHVASADAIQEALATGRADAALVDRPLGDGPIRARLLFRDPVELLAGLEGGDHDAPITPGSVLLRRHRLVVVAAAPYAAPFLAELEQRGWVVATMVVDQAAVAKRLAEEGVGLTLLPRLTVVRELLEGRLYNLPEADLPPLAPLAVFWVTPEPPPDIAAWAETILRRRWPGEP
ncbi:MAG: LysR family transcriptional regulator [Actinomycetia bacterium]|nr:LysR family transcriptional regulator [Actinomycetes bacterium]